MEFVLVLVVLIFISHLIAAYAERKGRSYWGFFALSGLCLPIGLAAALIATPSQESIVLTSNLVKCEFCAEYIKREAKICKHCGKEVSVKPISDIQKNIDNTVVNEYAAGESGALLIVASVFGVGFIIFLFTLFY